MFSIKVNQKLLLFGGSCPYKNNIGPCKWRRKRKMLCRPIPENTYICMIYDHIKLIGDKLLKINIDICIQTFHIQYVCSLFV